MMHMQPHLQQQHNRPLLHSGQTQSPLPAHDQQQQQHQQNGMMNMGMTPPPQSHYMNQQMQGQQQPQQNQPDGQQVAAPQTDSPPQQNASPQQCIRHGCQNPAIVNSDWEDEYCSNECVITHCRDVFGNWVQTNSQQQQQTYSAVK